MKPISCRQLPYITIILAAINILYFLYLDIAGSSMDHLFLIEHGAMYVPLIIEKREYYRIFTSMFMHFGFEHVSNNILILSVLGYRLERTIGKLKYLLLYLLSGVGANIISMLFDLKVQVYPVSVGASSAIFGVAGGLMYAVLVNRGRLEGLNSRQIVVMVLVSLYLGSISAGVDNVAHVAGLIIGFFVAVVLYQKPKISQWY